ncbi:hypothetical protein [Alicyclobacillus fodiniaquatilis]|uniref:Uncharacterized protein n=1 Tax=Alicyclobacillus fodiniaquatilis TaxID=1661150 RepID=A0ABW4JN53_9BACL
MGIVRLIYRTFKLFSLFYTLWQTTRVTRLFFVVRMLIRLFRKRSARRKRPKMAFTFVGANHTEIYRRRGWRRIHRKSEN